MYAAVSPTEVVDLGWTAMVVETRIRCRVNEFLVKGDQGSDQREKGPSYLRFTCKVTVQHAVRRLGGGGLAEPDRSKPPTTSECKSKHRVKDPSAFLDYDQTRGIAWRAFNKLPGLRGLDLAPSNWHEFTPSIITASIVQLVRENHDRGLCEGHYRFEVDMDIEVMLVFTEPKALLRYCSEEVMQTLDTAAAASDPCGICLNGLTSGPSRTPPLNLPCGHAFHSHCITKWFFKGTACPICRYELSGHAFQLHCITNRPTRVREGEALQQSFGPGDMAVETRISSRRSETRMEGHDGTVPLEEGPSHIRFICNITLAAASRRLGGGGLAQVEHAKPARRCESTHLVDDPSSFLDYNWTREAVRRELVGLIDVQRLRGLDHSPSNWTTLFPPDTVATSILQIVQANDDQGLCGGHYRFQVDMDIEVMIVYNEPKILLRYCSGAVMQTLDTTDGTCDPCGICLDGLTEPSKTPPLNLPCGHAFHAHCIRKWFFKGTVCPMCRYDLRGLFGAPWAKRCTVT